MVVNVYKRSGGMNDIERSKIRKSLSLAEAIIRDQLEGMSQEHELLVHNIRAANSDADTLKDAILSAEEDIKLIEESLELINENRV